MGLQLSSPHASARKIATFTKKSSTNMATRMDEISAAVRVVISQSAGITFKSAFFSDQEASINCSGLQTACHELNVTLYQEVKQDGISVCLYG